MGGRPGRRGADRPAVHRAGLALAVACFAVAAAGPAAAGTFVDSAGRRVEVPDKVSRVYTAGGPASVLLYVLAPDRLLGWTRALTPAERV